MVMNGMENIKSISDFADFFKIVGFNEPKREKEMPRRTGLMNAKTMKEKLIAEKKSMMEEKEKLIKMNNDLVGRIEEQKSLECIKNLNIEIEKLKSELLTLKKQNKELMTQLHVK